MTRHLVRSWDDLLRLTECDNASELIDLMEGHLEIDYDHGDPFCDIRAVDEAFEFALGCFDAGRGISGDHLTYPFPIRDLWKSVEEIGEDTRLRLEVLDLPYESYPEDSYELMSQFAAFFDIPESDLVREMGGGWYSVDDFDEPDPDGPCRWYGAGVPLQVVIGIHGERIFIAEPLPEMSRMLCVERRTGTTLTELGQAVTKISKKSQRGMAVCHGCRTYAHVQTWHETEVHDTHHRYCHSCISAYFDVILD